MSSSGDRRKTPGELVQPSPIDLSPSSIGAKNASIDGFMAFMSVMRRRILVASVSFVVVMALTALYTFTRQPTFQSVTIIDLNPNGRTGSGLSDALQQKAGFDELNSEVSTQVEELRSDQLQLEECKYLNLLGMPAFQQMLGPQTHIQGDCTNLDPHDRTVVVSALKEIIAVDTVAGTNLVRVKATTPNKELSKRIANGLVDVFISANLRAGVAGTQQVSDWLDGQMANLREQVSATQKDLSDFQRDKNIIGNDPNGQGATDELALIQQQLTTAAADRIQKGVLLKVAESNSPELLTSLADSGNIAALRNRRMQLQGEYDQLTTKFGPDYPTVKELSRQIADAQAALDKEVGTVRKKLQNDYTAAVSVENELNQRYLEKEQQAFHLNDSAARYLILRQNAEAARQLYNAISFKLRETGIEETVKSAEIRVIEPGVLADSPVFPKKGRLMFYGLVMALFAAAAMAYLLNYLDDSFHLPEIIEAITNLPLLVTVPHVPAMPETTSLPAGSRVSPRLVTVSDPMGLATESYRALRSSVLLSRADGNSKLQLVTSGSKSEGKTMTACNYAVTLAQQGHRVLLVDADLRRGTVHAYFGEPRVPGLSELLSSGQSTSSFVRKVAEVPGLGLIPIGTTPPNPSELLNSQRFIDLIDQWRNEYDFIIIDSAPLLPVADSYGLAAKADLVILVVRIEQTRTRSLVRSEEILRRLGAHVIGVVVNDITWRSQGYSYHYYGEYKYENREA